MMYKSGLVAAVKCNGKVLREQGDIVHLPFGSEYSLLLKNLSDKRVQVKIFVDGTDVIGGDALLIDKKSDLELERFLDGDKTKGRRFRFIERDGDIEEYRGVEAEDGLIRIEYQYEMEFAINWKDNTYNDNNWQWNYYSPTYGASSPTIGGHDGIICSNTSNLTSSTTPEGPNVRGSAVGAPVVNDNGITVKGSESNQRFENVGSIVTEAESHTIVLNLKGYDEKTGIPVKKAVTVKTKKQCPSCGRKYSSSNEYCARDGTYLEVA